MMKQLNLNIMKYFGKEIPEVGTDMDPYGSSLTPQIMNPGWRERLIGEAKRHYLSRRESRKLMKSRMVENNGRMEMEYFAVSVEPDIDKKRAMDIDYLKEIFGDDDGSVVNYEYCKKLKAY